MGFPVTIGGGGGFGNIEVPEISIDNSNNLIGQSSIDTAIGNLENPPSVFDVMSGGPIVDEINQRTDALIDANTTRAMADLDEALEVGLAQSVAQGGFISSSAVLEHRGRVTDDVLNDLNAFNAGVGLENTKYLGELALRDIQNGTNAAQALLAQAMIEKGINADVAVAEAQVAAQLAQAQIAAQAQIQSAQIGANASIANTHLAGQFGLAENAQDNALGLLQLGSQDFGNSLDRQIGVGSIPFDLLSGVSRGPGVGSSSGKTI